MTVNQRMILRLIVIAVAVLLFFAVATAASASANQVGKSLSQAEAFSASLKLNEGRFADPNLIQPGELVLVQTSYGVIEMRAGAPVNGRYDCIWNCVIRGLQEAEANEKARLLEEIRAENAANGFTVKVNETSPEESRSRARGLWLLALLPAFIFGGRWRKLEQEKKHDPDNYPAVGPDLTEAPMVEVIEEIQKTLEPGLTILEVERGYLERFDGPKKLEVDMIFGDGQTRKVWLEPGESICRARVKNSANQISWRWLRSACTNGMYSGLMGQLVLPHGWKFVRGQKAEPATNSAAEVIVTSTPMAFEPVTPVTKVSSFVTQMKDENTESGELKETAQPSTPKKASLKCRFHPPVKRGKGSCKCKKHLRGPRNRRNAA